MGIVRWLQHKLGIELLDSRVSRLEELEMFTLQDVADRLSDSMIVLAGDNQVITDLDIRVPDGKKVGVLVLGNYTMVSHGFLRPQKTKTTIEYLDEEPIRPFDTTARKET